jgi:hypothetical protein
MIKRTLLGNASELNVDKVNLKLLGGLDTNEKGGSAAGGDNLVGEVNTLEDHGEGALLLHFESKSTRSGRHVHMQSGQIEQKKWKNKKKGALIGWETKKKERYVCRCIDPSKGAQHGKHPRKPKKNQLTTFPPHVLSMCG